MCSALHDVILTSHSAVILTMHSETGLLTARLAHSQGGHVGVLTRNTIALNIEMGSLILIEMLISLIPH